MAKFPTVLIGALFGVLGGAIAGHMMVELNSTHLEKGVGGAFVGALCGVVGGSLGGDLAGQVDKNGSRNLYAMVSGAVAGALGGARSEGFVVVAAMITRLLYGLSR